MSTAPQNPACAEEGAQPTTTTTAGAGLTPAQWAALRDAERDAWLPLLILVGVVAGIALSILKPWGFA
jgi:hypothetical protein